MAFYSVWKYINLTMRCIRINYSLHSQFTCERALGVTAQKYYVKHYNAQMAHAYRMLNKPYRQFSD